MSKQSSALLSTTQVILIGIAWGLISLLFFLLFSVPPPGQEQPDWYFVGITILETGAFLGAGLLCLRNWRSSQIVSGRSVWLWIGIGLLCYVAGNGLFYLWGNVWGQDPSVSLGDGFYLLSYVFLTVGMLQAVLPRRLNLEAQQWIVIAVVGLSGIALAYFLNYVVTEPVVDEAPPEALEQVVPATPDTAPDAAPDAAAPDPAAAEMPAPSPAPAEAAPEEDGTAVPAWVLQVDEMLDPYEGIVSLMYVAGDCILVVVAATLLVAFWSGRFSQSWKLIAIAALCLYVADMFFAFSVKQADYQEGALWEVFWTFSALFFGIGAVVEHAISSRASRRPSRRRRAG
ncbi:MAG: hypothetical protein IGR92_09700 [Leptolyngbyaceae cyanobacterium T60_A2020_046]|nr:hypothetical protein [Leptolyngbyaceae cyanobacterium T60_A2020_046]